MIEASKVIDLLLKADANPSPARKAVASRAFDAYVKQQEEVKGQAPSRTRAAIKAIVTRKKARV
jgi:hypothetical protein